MANRSAAALVLRDGDRAELERRVRSGTGAAAAAQRARIVLLAADGVAGLPRVFRSRLLGFLGCYWGNPVCVQHFLGCLVPESGM
jgi:hypothetical protein